MEEQRFSAALEAQLAEEKRSSAWWKERVCVLDSRCRDIDLELAKALTEKRTLERTVTRLRNRRNEELSTIIEHPRVESATQTNVDDEKDLTIKSLIQALWNAQSESALISSAAAGCNCAAGEFLRKSLPKPTTQASHQGDPLSTIINRRKTTGRLSRNSRAAMAESVAVKVPVVEPPPHPHPEVFSDARKERKIILKTKMKATKRMVESLRRENGILEGLFEDQGCEFV